MKVFDNITLENLPEISKGFFETFSKNKIFAFYGKMGSGKTTFIKELCNNYGVIDNVTSPTFAIANKYETQSEDIIWHFDFYRIEKIEEAYDMGYEDYFYSGDFCLIEWPEIIKTLLPEKITNIEITEKPDGKRQITINEL